jgi:hypothetical protein
MRKRGIDVMTRHQAMGYGNFTIDDKTIKDAIAL